MWEITKREGGRELSEYVLNIRKSQKEKITVSKLSRGERELHTYPMLPVIIKHQSFSHSLSFIIAASDSCKK
jgi:hypothetical protein